MTIDELKIGISATVMGWAALLAYFPQDPHGKAMIMQLVESLVIPRGIPDRKALFTAANRLGWLNEAMVNQVGEWKGAKELRGIYCSRFQPADGIEGETEHPQFCAAAGEARAAMLESAKSPRLLEGATDPVSTDPQCRAIVEKLDEVKKLPVVARKSDELAARRWMESIGLGHMTGLPPLSDGK